MNSKTPTSLVRPLLLALILSVGILAVWALVGIFVVSWFLNSAPGEMLVITADGRALIRPSGNEFYQEGYRTIEGQPAPDAPLNTALADSVLTTVSTEKWERAERGWDERLLGFANSRLPASFWYFVHDGQAHGHAYFVGYDSQAKRMIGCLGRRGYRPSVPPFEERFQVDRGLLNFGAFAPQSAFRGAQPTGYNEGMTYLAADRRLYAINLAERTVKTVLEKPECLSVASWYTWRDELEMKAVVRTHDQLLLIGDDDGYILKSLEIPKGEQDRMFSLYRTINNSLVVVGQRDSQLPEARVYWFDKECRLERQSTVAISPGAITDAAASSWLYAGLLPSPAILAAVDFLLLPQQQIELGRAVDYASAVKELAPHLIPSLLLIAIISLIAATVVYLRQRRWAQPAPLIWAILVALTGPLGLAGYWAHRVWPVRARCPHCKAIVPLDRQSCATCASEFPLPSVLGIEIFACCR